MHAALFGEDPEPGARPSPTIQPAVKTEDLDGDDDRRRDRLDASTGRGGRRSGVAVSPTTSPSSTRSRPSSTTRAPTAKRLWAPADLRSAEHERVAGQWAGLVAKDVWQDALCSVWSEFCRSGVTASRARRGAGLGWDDVRAMARAMTAGPPVLDSERATSEVVDAIAAGHVSLDGVADADRSGAVRGAAGSDRSHRHRHQRPRRHP